MNKLNILWTNADPVTFENMVFMYAFNGKTQEWWDEITLIIWGSTADLAVKNDEVQYMIKELLKAGVRVSACKACAQNLNAVDALEAMGVEVIYWGQGLTEILQGDEKLLTI